ncbi:MAG: TIGR03905 family TSCPD domain-containing protein [Clostridia bacterium]|nr:TIGR03905 family TSCPD domain-containing protein [Clostridia bacterium]
MLYTYRTKGTCSAEITFELDEDTNLLHNVAFKGGCNGNLKAIGKLVEGRDAKEVMETLRGNTCGPRSTSCADQLARAIEEALN